MAGLDKARERIASLRRPPARNFVQRDLSGCTVEDPQPQAHVMPVRTCMGRGWPQGNIAALDLCGLGLAVFCRTHNFSFRASLGGVGLAFRARTANCGKVSEVPKQNRKVLVKVSTLIFCSAASTANRDCKPESFLRTYGHRLHGLLAALETTVSRTAKANSLII